AAFKCERPGSAGQVGISQNPRTAMARDVELGKHADASIMRVGEEVANLVLRIVHAVRTHPCQLRKLLAFDAEALIIRKMPVQHIHLYRSQAVDVAFEHVERDEVAADIDEQAAPRKARLIFDGDGGGSESGRRDLDELQKRLQAAQDAERRGRSELRAGVGDGQFVRFILAEFLYDRAAVVGMNLQRWRGARRGAKGNPSLARELRLESLYFAVKRRVVSASHRNSKRSRDRQLARA